MLPEKHELNTLWTDSATNQVIGYLAYDLWFLLHHAQLAASHSASISNEVAVCDWSFLSDRIWAQMRLKDDLSLYEDVHRTLLQRVGSPIGYLYLRQRPAAVLDRVKRRGRQGESGFFSQMRKAVRLLDEVVESLPPQMVMTVLDKTSVPQVDEQVAHWLKERVDVS